MDNPNFMKIQNQIRANADNIRDYVSDLEKWENEIDSKDKKVKKDHQLVL